MLESMTAEQVHRAVAARWDLSGRFPRPVPGWLGCPVCGMDKVQVRWWRWHTRPATATVRYRCDVSLKCCVCSAVWLHGVPVPDDYWRSNAIRPRKQIPRREALRLMGGGSGG